MLKAGIVQNTESCTLLACLQRGKPLCFSSGLEHRMSRWMLTILAALEKERPRRWDCSFPLQSLREIPAFFGIKKSSVKLSVVFRRPKIILDLAIFLICRASTSKYFAQEN